jgi:hypothetical protein
MENLIIPMVKFTPSYIVKYYEHTNKKKPTSINNFATRDKKSYHNETLSEHSIKKIKKAIDWFIYLSEKKTIIDKEGKEHTFKLNFITLTLPAKQNHDDKTIVKVCLNNFLNILRNKYNVIHYIWRAERQKNGNLHFHLITDKFIPWNEIRYHWNNSLELLYYISAYEQKMKKLHNKGFAYRPELNKYGFDYQKQYKAYQKSLISNFRNPNTTDIHAIKYVGNLKIYLLKYFTKQYQNENIECSFYRISHALSKLDGYKTGVDSRITEFLYDKIDMIKHKFISLQFSSIFVLPINCLLKLKLFDLYNEFKLYVNNILSTYLDLSFSTS